MPKTVLITGSSSGIGKATVELFAASGWQVAATSRKIDKKLFEKFPNIACYVLDVTDTTSIKNAFAAAYNDFGSIDVVVNNAGYGLDGIFEATEDKQIRSQFDTNVFGLMNVTREAIKYMKPAGSGQIVQVSSMGGRVTFPLFSLYHASKWAVEGFSESLHYELRQLGIQIKIIEPGVIKTEFYGRNRKLAKPTTSLGYGTLANKVESVSHPADAKGNSPEIVAKTILKAAESTSSKLRYIVGSPAPALLALRKILPERVFFWIIRSRFHI